MSTPKAGSAILSLAGILMIIVLCGAIVHRALEAISPTKALADPYKVKANGKLEDAPSTICYSIEAQTRTGIIHESSLFGFYMEVPQSPGAKDVSRKYRMLFPNASEEAAKRSSEVKKQLLDLKEKWGTVRGIVCEENRLEGYLLVMEVLTEYGK